MPEERVVSLRPRTVVTVAAVLVGLAIALWVVYVSRQVLVWLAVAIFLALALNPGVEWLQRRGVARRSVAASIIFLAFLVAMAAVAAAIGPSIADQVEEFADDAPGYVRDLSSGDGPLGSLERRYQLSDRLQDALSGAGPSSVVAVARNVVGTLLAIVTIAFMTFFLLIEGPAWFERLVGLLPHEQRDRWRAVGGEIARTVSGYVSGNLLISAIAGASTALVAFAVGAPYPLGLALIVAILDLIPLAGATIAAVIVVLVALLTSTTAAIVMGVFFIVYQQLENHLLQPLVYGRVVQLSPLTVILAVLIGAKIAGILGALGAIPAAGAIRVVLADVRRHRQTAAPNVVRPDEPPPPADEPRFAIPERGTPRVPEPAQPRRPGPGRDS